MLLEIVNSLQSVRYLRTGTYGTVRYGTSYFLWNSESDKVLIRHNKIYR